RARSGLALVRFAGRVAGQLAGAGNRMATPVWDTGRSRAGSGSPTVVSGTAFASAGESAAARAAGAPGASGPRGRHPALLPHASYSETARISEPGLVHAGGVRRLAAAHGARSAGFRVHVDLQCLALWRPHGGGAGTFPPAGSTRTAGTLIRAA